MRLKIHGFVARINYFANMILFINRIFTSGLNRVWSLSSTMRAFKMILFTKLQKGPTYSADVQSALT